MASHTRTHSWQDIQSQIRARIEDRTWQPGDLIPGEVVLAEQFGCARTTVNRALRELAATGVLDRKRKAGTRIAKQPVRKATTTIPMVRSQIESDGSTYRFELLQQGIEVPPAPIESAMKLRKGQALLHVTTLHYASDTPYLFEERWVNTETVPDVLNVNLHEMNLNEWLVSHIPFSRGEQEICANNVDGVTAKALGIKPGVAILSSTRTTWLERQSVTRVVWHHSPDFSMQFKI